MGRDLPSVQGRWLEGRCVHRSGHAKAAACIGQRGKGACGQACALRWSGLRFAAAPLAAQGSWPVAELTSLTSFAAFKQAATSRITTRAAREATSSALLGAPEARSSLPARTLAATFLPFRRKAPTMPERQAPPGGGEFWGDEMVWTPPTCSATGAHCQARAIQMRLDRKKSRWGASHPTASSATVEVLFNHLKTEAPR